MTTCHYVDFNPNDPEHIVAFAMLAHHGRQHPSLRFVVKYPFTNALVMMQDAISRAYVSQFTYIDSRIKELTA